MSREILAHDKALPCYSFLLACNIVWLSDVKYKHMIKYYPVAVCDNHATTYGY